MSFNIIKTCHERSFLVLLFLNLGILETKHKCTTLLSTDLAWIFHYFCARRLVLFWPVKKESRLILKNFQIIYLIYYTLLQLSSNYTSYWLNWIPRKFLKTNKLFHLEIYIVKLKYNDTIPPFKMEIRTIYTKGNVCKAKKNHELQS